jgi:HEAT repeat protein
MKCQEQGCQETAINHVTEIVEGNAAEFHLCENHVKEFFSGEETRGDRLRKMVDAESMNQAALTAVGAKVWVQYAIGLFSRYKAGGALPALIELLHDADANVRWVAVMTLSRIGQGNSAVAAALRESSQDDDEEVRAAATWALTRIERQAT